MRKLNEQRLKTLELFKNSILYTTRLISLLPPASPAAMIGAVTLSSVDLYSPQHRESYCLRMWGGGTRLLHHPILPETWIHVNPILSLEVEGLFLGRCWPGMN